MWFRFDPELTVLSQNHEATDMESLPWSQWPERQNSNNSPDRISCESESAHFGAGITLQPSVLRNTGFHLIRICPGNSLNFYVRFCALAKSATLLSFSL